MLPAETPICVIAPTGDQMTGRLLKGTSTRHRVGFPAPPGVAFTVAGQGIGKAAGWRIRGEDLARLAKSVPSEGIIVEADARPVADSAHRWWLARWWGAGPRVLFVMLNPSTATASKNDPTIRRCISFARREGFAGFEVVNLFAFRSAYPSALRGAVDPVGADNDAEIASAAARIVANGGKIIAAWGSRVSFGKRAKPAFQGRDAHVLALLGADTDVWCLGRGKTGTPNHPLMLDRTQALEMFATREQIAGGQP
jgi:hypothetical protein